MAASPSSQDIFDVRRIRRLIELMKEHDLNELDLRQGETRIQLRRGGDVPAMDTPTAPTGFAAPQPARAPAPNEQPAEAPPATESKHETTIKSPMVGTFYSSPDPDSPAYVKVGDHVGQDTTVCIVEAMKVFNQIPAEISGKIAAVLVENGEPVEFGQPLFKVSTRE